MNLPMPCGWTARAEVGIGAITILAGVLLAVSKSNETKRMIGIIGIALGILTILFPLYITKMCALADHPCNLSDKTLPGTPRYCVYCCIMLGNLRCTKRGNTVRKNRSVPSITRTSDSFIG